MHRTIPQTVIYHDRKIKQKSILSPKNKFKSFLSLWAQKKARKLLFTFHPQKEPTLKTLQLNYSD